MKLFVTEEYLKAIITSAFHMKLTCAPQSVQGPCVIQSPVASGPVFLTISSISLQNTVFSPCLLGSLPNIAFLCANLLLFQVVSLSASSQNWFPFPLLGLLSITFSVQTHRHLVLATFRSASSFLPNKIKGGYIDDRFFLQDGI